MTNITQNTIIAQILGDNSAHFKNRLLTAITLGDAVTARKWKDAVKALRIPAYHVAEVRHNNMGKALDAIETPDQSALYDALTPVLAMIGPVNGAKLNPRACAEAIIGASSTYRAIDLTAEMAHARCEKTAAMKALRENDTEENQANYDHWAETVKTMEGTAGNCRMQFEAVKEASFVKAVERLFGDAINGQMAKTADAIQAEMDALKAERKAKRQAKRQAAAKANATESK